MGTDLLTFPRNRVYRLEADSVRLNHDLIQFYVELYRGGRLLREVFFAFPGNTLTDARAEVERLVANGLRRLPDAVPDWSAVACGSLSYGGLDDDPDPRLSDILNDGGDAV